MEEPGAVLASTLTTVAALGFVPVAIHFDFFHLLYLIGPIATAKALTDASNEARSREAKPWLPLSLQLTKDTMFAMAGLNFVDLVDDTTFEVNSITRHIVEVPSSLHGMLHFTTEVLWASAFLMPKLQHTDFKYPFQENDTPTQYGYQMTGQHHLAREHTYAIMQAQGRMPSFNLFMEGKFGSFGTMPERLKRYGYSLDYLLQCSVNDIAVVDIGGGRGEMLLEVKEACPNLQKQNLVLQEFHPETVHAEELTITHWDFKDESPESIRGAFVYSLTHIYHNLSDLEALRLMKKLSAAMASHSRMLIHEFPKNTTYGKMHAAMIELYAGRLRSSQEWKQMADLANLEVTFEEYPFAGEGLIEMRKIVSRQG